MTLNAQPFITGTAQVEFKQRPVTGVVTRITGHWPTIAWVMCCITGRVTEVVMVFVTIEAGFISRSFKHGWLRSTVQLVTVETALSMGVEIEIVIPPFKFSSMAVTTDLTRITPNQAFLLTGMRSVTVKAERSITAGADMIELLVEALHDTTVTLQTRIFSPRLIVTTLTLRFGKRLVLVFSQQRLVLRLVRMVTFETIHFAQLAIQMAGTEFFILLVASKTELCPLLPEQHWLVAAVSIVTNVTFPLNKRAVTNLFCLLQLLMTSQTEWRHFIPQQLTLRGGVGIVTT